MIVSGRKTNTIQLLLICMFTNETSNWFTLSGAVTLFQLFNDSSVLFNIPHLEPAASLAFCRNIRRPAVEHWKLSCNNYSNSTPVVSGRHVLNTLDPSHSLLPWPFFSLLAVLNHTVHWHSETAEKLLEGFRTNQYLTGSFMLMSLHVFSHCLPITWLYRAAIYFLALAWFLFSGFNYS